MEKIKFIVYFALGIVVLILLYSLSKSLYFFQDYSVKLNEQASSPKKGSEAKTIEKTHNHLEENSKILWKNYLFYPTDLVREAGGFGPDEVMSHAKNLTFINLSSGIKKKIFKKNVYILDYFTGEFQKKISKNQEQPKESLEIENRLLIFAMTEDTNKDGFLNQKDLIKVYVYHPFEEKLYDILPEKYYFQKLVLNSKKNILVFILKKNSNPEKKESIVYTYNTELKKGRVIKEDEGKEF